MRTGEACVIDPSRPCGGCSAPGPRQCPYRYLLDADELAAIAAGWRAATEHAGDRPAPGGPVDHGR